MSQHERPKERTQRSARSRQLESDSNSVAPTVDAQTIPFLQQAAGNQAVQRLIREGRLSGLSGQAVSGSATQAIRRMLVGTTPDRRDGEQARLPAADGPMLQREVGRRTPIAPTEEDRRDFARDQQRFVSAAIEQIRVGGEAHRVGTRTGASIDSQRARTQLGGWLRTLESALRTIDRGLGSDAALRRDSRRDLRQAYVTAVQTLIGVASRKLRRTPRALYQEYRDVIHEWAYAVADAAADALTVGLSRAERRRIRIVTTSVTIANLHDLFSTEGGRVTVPLPNGVSIRFSGAIPNHLQHGLRNVAGFLTTQMQTLEVNSAITLALSLERLGGDFSTYRFTYVRHPAAAGHPATREILVEQQGATFVEGLSRGQGQASRQRFGQHGFRRGLGWSESEFERLLGAIARLPDAMLSPIDGLRFERHNAHPTKPEVGGDYNPDTHTVQIFDRAFTASQTRTGAPGAGQADTATSSILHEIGHAIDLQPLRQAWSRLESAQTALRTAFAEHEKPPGSGNYSFPNTEQARWNQLQAQITAAQAARNQARSRSGYRWQLGQGGRYAIVQGPAGAGNNAFRQAAAQDRGVRITRYSDTDWEEYFAESFSLYRTVPAHLQQLRPLVYGYFAAQFPVPQ